MEVHPSGVNAGGGESATLGLAKSIRKKGHRVIACANLPEGETEAHGIEFWNFGSSYSLKTIELRLRDIGSYHSIAATLGLPFLFLSDHKNCLSKILINHAPSCNASGVTPNTLFTWIDRMICVSEAQKKMIIDHGGQENKISVVRNGFDPELFTYAGPEGRDWMHIIFVGRVDSWKGAHLLIDGFPYLKKHFPKVQLSFFGDYTSWSEMKRVKEKLEREEPQIHFHGKVSQREIAAHLRTAGLLAFPSISFESAGLAVVDAQASGCPVVAFDTGGVAEHVFQNECGIVVKEQNLDHLMHGIKSLLSNPDRLQYFSSNCLTRARSRTWDVVASDILKITSEIAEMNQSSQVQKIIDIEFLKGQAPRAIDILR